MGQNLSRYRPVSKHDVIKKTNTGDIILMSGNSLFSLAIKCFTQSEWSHVGVVIKNITIKGKIREGPYILQAIISNEGYEDYLENFKKSAGVQLNLLSDVLDKNKGKVCWRKFTKLSKPSYIPLTLKSTAFIKKACKYPYELNLQELLNVITHANDRAGDSSYFCSELVAEFYFISDNVAKPRKNHMFSNNVLPSQFDEHSNDPFIFENGYGLGETRFII
jgi:hypothetical protein